MTLRGWLRTWAAPDITLLGCPGYRFWFAHVRYIVLYSKQDWAHKRASSQKRHAEWVETGKPITLKRNYRGSLYVDGPRKKDGE